MENQVKKVLFLPKWYPDKYDLQFGVFLQKHAKAVSLYADVAVLYVTPDPELTTHFRIEETLENGFPEIRVYYRKSNIAFTPLRKIINLRRYLKGNSRGMECIRQRLGKPDVVHVNILSRPGAIALRIKKKTGTPYFITEQWTGYASGKFEAKNSLEKYYSRKIGKNAAGILTVSNSLKNQMERNGFENTFHIIPNIIETINLQQLPKPDGRKVRMLNISDLDDPKKNVSGIIRVFARVAVQRNDIELHIIGGGPDEKKLRELAKSTGLMDRQIFMYGRRFNDFVYKTVPTMNFLITNSNFETFSVATAEALICGKPVIVSRSGGPEEFVTEEVGIVIDKEADDQLEKAMRYMVDHHTDYAPEKLSQYAWDRFSYEKVGQHFMDIYKTAFN